MDVPIVGVGPGPDTEFELELLFDRLKPFD